MSSVKIKSVQFKLRALLFVSIIAVLFWNCWYITTYLTEVFCPEIKPVRVSQSVILIKDFQRDWLRERQHRVDWRGFIKPCKGQMEWRENKAGWGKRNRSNAAASTISLWDIRPAGEFSKFLIQSRTVDGRAKSVGGDWWRVHLRGPSSHAATIFDYSNGSYEALFLIMEPGVYRVLIYLDYSLCDGLKDPPRDWFIRGNAQGSYQRDDLLGTLDDYLLQDFVHGSHLNITVPPRRLYSTIRDRLQNLNSPCRSKCRFLWDGFGRWVNNTWKPFLEQSFEWNTLKLTQPSGTFWTYGDSLARLFARSVKSRPLCRQLYAQCNYSYNWIYPVSGGKASTKKANDDLDFDKSRVINYIRVALDNTVMRTADSTLYLNLGIHFAQKVNFTTFQAVLHDIVELLREKDATSTGTKVPRYKANVVWKTTTAVNKEKSRNLHSVSFRFLTAQRVYLFSIYAASVMCRAGHQVLDVYPLTDSFPHGTMGRYDPVHYADPVFQSVQELLEKHKAAPEGIEADLKKTRVATCTSWET